MSIIAAFGQLMQAGRPKIIPPTACMTTQTTSAVAGFDIEPFIPWALLMAFISYSGGLWRWEVDESGEIFRFDLTWTGTGWYAELTQDVDNVLGNYAKWEGIPVGAIDCIGGVLTFTDGGVTFDGVRVELISP